jgi:prepilin-type N-terminal cleavage/methylation domain-containing protein
VEGHRDDLVSVLKEIGKMRDGKKRHAAKGFTLLETMIALVVLGVGVLGLAALLADSLSYMQGSQDDFIAQQKAEEAAEAIYTAKYTNNATFSQLSNNTVGNPVGLFLVGPQPLLIPGADGLVGSVADAGGTPAFIVYPGADGKLGTADDVRQSLGNFTRTIAISAVPGYTSLNQVVITMNYATGRFKRSYTLTTYISAF